MNLAAARESESGAVARLRARFASAIREVQHFRDEETVLINPAAIVEVCRFLMESPELSFQFLSDLCGVHFLEREYTYEVVYHLYSFRNKQRLRLKVRLGPEGRVASVTPVWAGANWLEREAYDLVGIHFEGHPDLRRILMPEDYDQHPLRRDFPLSG